MKQLGIIAALPAEASCLIACNKRNNRVLSAASSSPQPLLDKVLLMVSGIGETHAAQAAHTLIENGADALLSWGCAGALSAALKPGDLLLPRSIHADATGGVPTNPAWHARLSNHLSDHQLCTDALFSSADIMTEPAQKQALFRSSGAVAVDMESAAIAVVAQNAQIPFMVIRAVIDDAATTIPACLNAAMHNDGRIHHARMLRLLLMHPPAWLRLIRLGYQFKAAKSTLSRVASMSDPDFFAFANESDP